MWNVIQKSLKDRRVALVLRLGDKLIELELCTYNAGLLDSSFDFVVRNGFGFF